MKEDEDNTTSHKASKAVADTVSAKLLFFLN